METEIKWADVAHYYQKSEILIQTNDVGIREMLGAQGTRGVMYATRAHAMLSRWGQHKPILRDDKTEAEETEIRRMETSEETIMRLKYGVMSPKVLAKHFEMGIDVFGLIKSGQAIRKSIV